MTTRISQAIRASVFLALILPPLHAALNDPPPSPGPPRAAAGPLSPEAALKAFQIEPGYQIELVAAEPLIVDPVAMAFDGQGRLYVVENRGYPDPLDPDATPALEGRVARLEDTNGDGAYDLRIDFADGLSYPNGIMIWDGGVFVSCAPDLWFLKDSTGDGLADVREVVLTGFAATQTAQIRFSHPTLGLDNWIYLTSGLNGGKVTAPAHPDRPPVEFTRSDSRFHPRDHRFELTSGQGQYGLTFDNFGRRFICANRHPVWQVMLEPAHLNRNPHRPFSQTVHEVSKVAQEAVVWPISADMTTASFIPSLMSAPHAGTFTAASGVHIHRGDALPDGHENSVFICESAQNLVQRQILTPRGAAFESSPARAGVEFLAARDHWFSPVFLANGPDGALYIVDMYRENIDHPRYVPEESRPLLDFEAGKDRGRIYRVRADVHTEPSPPFDPERAAPGELVNALAHPNAWWRKTAQRLLVESQTARAIPHLQRFLGTAPTPEGRVHSLWTLHGLNGLTGDNLRQALDDPHPGVRENALRLAEERLQETPQLLDQILPLAADTDARVRFQLALTLGAASDPRVMPALAAIAARDGHDIWARAAVLSSIGLDADDFLKAFIETDPDSDAVTAAVMRDLARIFGAGQPPEKCLELLLELTGPRHSFSWQPAALAGLAAGLERRGHSRSDLSALADLVSQETAPAVEARSRLASVLERSRQVVPDETRPLPERLAAIELLAQDDLPATVELLSRLLEFTQPAEIQLAAVRALAAIPVPAGAATLTARWPAYTPQVRQAVLALLMSQTRHLTPLLDAVESGAIPSTAFNPALRARLLKHRDERVRRRAGELFGHFETGDRMRVYERYRDEVLGLKGDRENGLAVFANLCAACHTFGRTGGSLGPDLSGIGNQPADAILLHTLVPDHEITPGYEAYLVETRDGQIINGLFEAESTDTITLRDALGHSHTILRTEVLSVTASAHSLMPGELEQSISKQDLADLIAYLKSGAPTPPETD